MRELQLITNIAIARLDQNAGLVSHCSIIGEDKGDIDKAINIAVATLGKVSVLVMLKSVSTQSPNAAGPIIDDCEIFIEIAENVLLNRRGIDGTDYLTALDVAQIVLSTDGGLHQYREPTTGISFLVEGEFLKPTPPPPGATTAYTLYFKTTGLIFGDIPYTLDAEGNVMVDADGEQMIIPNN